MPVAAPLTGSLLDALAAIGRRQLHVHCTAGAGHEPRPSAECALLMAGPDDLVCLPRATDPAYLDYLRSCGLGPEPENIIVPGGDRAELMASLAVSPQALRRIAQRLGPDSVVLHPFHGAPETARAAAALRQHCAGEVQVLGGQPATVTWANRKDRIRTGASRLGVPVAKGEVVRLPSDRDGRPTDHVLLGRSIERRFLGCHRVIVRGAEGASGSSVAVVDSRSAVRDVVARIARRDPNRCFLVEEMVEATVSPAVVTCVAPAGGAIACVGIADQRLGDGVVHLGNAAPSRALLIDEMVRSAMVLSRWLQNEGYAGLLGFDFVEYTGRDGAPAMLLAEIDACLTDAAYVFAAAERLGAPAFVTGSTATGVTSFDRVQRRLGALLLRPGSAAGVLPYDIGRLATGRCRFVAVADSRDDAEAMAAEAVGCLDEPAVPVRV